MSRFVWFEAMVDDLEAASARLAFVPGWTLIPRPGPEPYVEIRAGDVAIGGLMPIPEDVKDESEDEIESHWIAHVAVDDVAALCRRVAFVQGEVLVEPTELEDVGTTALVVDPIGAVIAPCSFLKERPPDDDRPGALAFATLLAPRRDLGARVYRTLLDWREHATIDTAIGSATILREGDRPICALIDGPKVVGPQWIPHVLVDDVDAVLDALDEDDGDVLLGPTEVAGVGTLALVVLDDGLLLGLIER